MKTWRSNLPFKAMVGPGYLWPRGGSGSWPCESFWRMVPSLRWMTNSVRSDEDLAIEPPLQGHGRARLLVASRRERIVALRVLLENGAVSSVDDQLGPI